MLMMVAPFLSRDRDRDLRRTSSASLLIIIFCSSASGSGGILFASVLSSSLLSTVMDLTAGPAPISRSVLGMAMVFWAGLAEDESRTLLAS